MWVGLAIAAQAAMPGYFPPDYASPTVHCHWPGRIEPILRQRGGIEYGVELAKAGEPSLYRQAQAGGADALRFFRVTNKHGTVTVRVEGLATQRRPV